MKKRILHLIIFIQFMTFSSCDSSKKLNDSKSVMPSTTSDISTILTPLTTFKVHLTVNEAFDIYQSWLKNHANLYTVNKETFELYDIDGIEYYLFHADDHDKYWYNILVNSETGELLFMMTSDGEYPITHIEPIDEWYEKKY